eukprot:CAMPEP_0197846328 /NCGR_PEP_ID=MMETSP1438-20131217/3089_1 /TAXON_ID=1461541 /ORGANISM="Pterosperma sp., Strain CCMP1384" /LENGTH=86 /DNA_ID=CAMNT_0043457929 /DNA_START=29 /DNA_END=289 /DNA_ORIENTATION=+
MKDGHAEKVRTSSDKQQPNVRPSMDRSRPSLDKAREKRDAIRASLDRKRASTDQRSPPDSKSPPTSFRTKTMPKNRGEDGKKLWGM